ncbi:MAG: PDZ domain-containing protein [Candidatus Hydrogenedentota bacterium]|uniref:Serine protease, Do/DeqQ family n=1 Tax=Sumerlaea chitinivorans TaxID=2250252 RepID=A0A2Z4Y4U1_SUMC1|nr:serine protease, Do/DeqQ family [Candidatus Sumerlaea chitinivorans]MCX7964909.1 trypsin-like peptidase domain-containing protein [Candidatus Sumerlaea chitinivorans]RMH27732.1 MAG: PDZ domain-containing protein [Candidatus Hydrogenedentota bacterium]GIX44048.1 MAG: MucD protein [Candidatus Sumerlaea sp.]
MFMRKDGLRLCVFATLLVALSGFVRADQVITRETFRNVARKVSPAVVNVKVRSNIQFSASAPSKLILPPGLGLDEGLREELERLHEQFSPYMTPRDEEEFKYARSASGVIIRPEGYIVTSNHVIEDVDPASLEVSLPDGRTFTNVELVGTDKLTDLAVLKIDGKDLPSATWGDSDKLEVGDMVVAIGNPLDFTNSVSEGIISAKHRVIRKAPIEDLLQTTAMINPGNSGGALVNLDGEVVGINMAIATSTGMWSGLGFAIPSKTARDVTDQIIAKGRVSRGYLGIEMDPLRNALARQLNYDGKYGIVVKNVNKGTPAEQAGLQRYDIIAKVNGVEIKDIDDMHRNIGTRAPGDTVELEVWRDEGGSKPVKKIIRVQLGERPTEKELAARNRAIEQPLPGKKVSPELLGLVVSVAPDKRGLIIDDVESGSPAARGGLAKGDRILQVNKQDVNSVEELRGALRKSSGEGHLFFIERDGSSAMVTISEKP